MNKKCATVIKLKQNTLEHLNKCLYLVVKHKQQ